MNSVTATPPDHRSDHLASGFTYLYFFGTEDGEEVKFGKSKDPAGRKRQHEVAGGHHAPLRWLAVWVGSQADEGAIKAYFERYCSRGRSKEWLRATDEVRGYLRWLRAQPYVAPQEAEMTELAVLTQVDSDHWLPNGVRQKSFAQLELMVADPWGDVDTSVVMEGDFYTHPSIIEAARVAMGAIELDPASCLEANRVVKANEFYGARENGLLRRWHGRVWCNPPFGNWDGWGAKLCSEWRHGAVDQACVLAPTRAITGKGNYEMVGLAAAVWVAFGRLPFWGPKAAAPDEGHVVFYFGAERQRFKDAFERDGFGTVFYSSSECA